MRQTEHQEASFTLLEATYLERTGLRFEPSDYVSFGLADKNGFLTNAGKLMTDQHTVYNSRMFCTRWNGLEKGSIFDDALDDKEYEGNLIYLLKSGSEFIRNNSKVRFVKEAQYRVDKPDYAERAVTEALVQKLPSIILFPKLPFSRIFFIFCSISCKASLNSPGSSLWRLE